MKAELINRGEAPETARSLTVPQTANFPMFPPGKNIGSTTKESVVKASFDWPKETIAESV